MSLAPAQNGIKSREKVSKGAGRLPGVCKQVRVQFNANFSRSRQGIDITLTNVGPQFQTTTCGSGPAVTERRAHSGAAGRQYRRGRAGGEHTCPCWTSAALWGPAALRDTAERRHPPTPTSEALVALRPRCPRNYSPGGDCGRGLRRCGPAHYVGAIASRQHLHSHGGKPGY